MEYRTRDHQTVRGNDGQDRLLSALYGSAPGRGLVSLLVRPWISALGGWFLSTGFSKLLIQSFIRKNHIDMEQYQKKDYKSYNDFFTRKIRPQMRPVDRVPGHLISPCDGKLTVIPITGEGRLVIKGISYTVGSLLRDEKLAERYQGGQALVFRLTVDDYHRFLYPDSAKKSKNRRISGCYHTVNPAAAEKFPIYKENHREYCLLKTENFGTLLMMEVGALMVGRIVNHHEAAMVERGQEKGYFEFGGSTIVLLIQRDRAEIDSDILRNTEDGIETIIRAGEKIGVK